MTGAVPPDPGLIDDFLVAVALRQLDRIRYDVERPWVALSNIKALRAALLKTGRRAPAP